MRFITYLLLFFSITTNAQSPFTIYNTENSLLPDNLVNTVYIDADQNKWIGTQSGLVKIDIDNNWTVLNTTNSGLPENDIRAVYVDDENILWVGMFQKGLSKYDGADWINYNTTNSELPDDFVRAIIKDANDTIWIGSTGGLTKWNGADEWFTYTISNSEIKSNNITDILIDDTGKKFIGTINGGLTTLDNGELQYFRTENSDIGDNTVLGLAKDDSYNIWMATAFGGLSIYTADGNFLNFGIANSDIPDWEVADVAVDESQGFLAMNVTGLALFDATDWENFTAENSALPDDNLNSIAMDANGIAWIGTETAGLVTYDKNIIQSVNTISQNAISVYPNPANNYLNIKSDFEFPFDIIIVNSNGETVITVTNYSENTIDISNLTNGMYFLKMHSQKNTCFQYFIKSR
ncbi:MAG: T9SS type A sorting domain-containing protein [Bacteroidetes bacterium]|nr:T9SS type A sorting domain-containing protein [Bacteroidota bacterium]